MPNKEVVFKLGADVTNVKAAVEQISHAMESVTLPKGLTKDIDAALTQLSRGITDFESKKGTAKSPLDFSKALTSGEKVVEQFEKLKVLVREVSRLGNKEFEKLIPPELTQAFDTMERKLSEYSKEYKQFAAQKEKIDKQLETNAKRRAEKEKALNDVQNELKGATKGKKRGTIENRISRAQDTIKAEKRVEDIKGFQGYSAYRKKVSENKKAGREETYGLTDKEKAWNRDINKLSELKGSKSMPKIREQLSIDQATIKQWDELLKKVQAAQTALQQFNSTDNTKELQQELTNLGEAGEKSFSNLQQFFTDLGFSPEEIQSVETMTQTINNIKSDTIKEMSDNAQNVVNSMHGASDAVDTFDNQVREDTASLQQWNVALNDANAIKNRIASFFQLTSAVQLARRAISDAFQTVKELDAVMAETAVVTNFSIGDMWEQLPQYTESAMELGVAIKDVYEATTLYYQMGLKTKEATELATETMKMARIAGLDAADATDRVTAAIKGFNMEMNRMSGQRVSDVYSELAAISASDVDELSTAMSKTASIANSANMEFETTSAMLAQIIETTREAPETAGTALKTVIARFNELKKAPSEIGEIDGEIVDANAIETALRSVGIALRGLDGQLRDTDDVFMDLSKVWNTLDTNTQHYIATLAAGSRQQSRFIALLSDNERLQELVNAAYNSSGASQKQYEKTLDSLQTKLARLRDAYDTFTSSIANSTVIKGAIDALTIFLNTINKIIAALSGSSSVMKTYVALLISLGGFQLGKVLAKQFTLALENVLSKAYVTGRQIGENAAKGVEAGIKKTPQQRAQGAKNRVSEKFRSIGRGFNKRMTEAQARQDAVDQYKQSGLTGVQGLPTGIHNYSKALKAGDTNAANKYADEVQKLSKGQIKLQKNVVSAEQAVQDQTAAMNAAAVAAGALGMALTAIGGVLKKAGYDETAEVITSIGEGFMVLSVVVPAAAKVMSAAGIAVQTAWWPLLIITAAIAAIMVAVKVFQKTYKTVADIAKEYEESVTKAQEALEESNKELENLYDLRSKYKDYQKQLEDITYGTLEWKKALLEVNNQVLNLLNTYPQLAKYVGEGEYGQLTINTAGWDELINLQQKRVSLAQSNSLSAQKDYNNFNTLQSRYAYESSDLFTNTRTNRAYGNNIFYRLTPGQWFTGEADTSRLKNKVDIGNYGQQWWDNAGNNLLTLLSAGFYSPSNAHTYDAEQMQFLEEQFAKGKTAEDIYNESFAKIGFSLQDVQEAVNAMQSWTTAIKTNTLLLESFEKQIVKANMDDIVSSSEFADDLASYIAREYVDGIEQGKTYGQIQEEKNLEKVKSEYIANDEDFKMLAQSLGVDPSAYATPEEQRKQVYAAMQGVKASEVEETSEAIEKALAKAITDQQKGAEARQMYNFLATLDGNEKTSALGMISDGGKAFTANDLDYYKVNATALAEDARTVGMAMGKTGEDLEKFVQTAIQAISDGAKNLDDAKRIITENFAGYSDQISKLVGDLSVGAYEQFATALLKIPKTAVPAFLQNFTDAFGDASADTREKIVGIMSGVDFTDQSQIDSFKKNLTQLVPNIAQEKVDNFTKELTRLAKAVYKVDFSSLITYLDDVADVIAKINSADSSTTFTKDEVNLLTKYNSALSENFIPLLEGGYAYLGIIDDLQVKTSLLLNDLSVYAEDKANNQIKAINTFRQNTQGYGRLSPKEFLSVLTKEGAEGPQENQIIDFLKSFIGSDINLSEWLGEDYAKLTEEQITKQVEKAFSDSKTKATLINGIKELLGSGNQAQIDSIQGAAKQQKANYDTRARQAAYASTAFSLYDNNNSTWKTDAAAIQAVGKSANISTEYIIALRKAMLSGDQATSASIAQQITALKDYQAFGDAINEVSDNWKDMLEELSQTKNVERQNTILMQLAREVGDVFGTTLPLDIFITTNALDDLKLALQGNEKAWISLGKKIFQTGLNTIDLNNYFRPGLDLSGLKEDLNQLTFDTQGNVEQNLTEITKKYEQFLKDNVTMVDFYSAAGLTNFGDDGSATLKAIGAISNIDLFSGSNKLDLSAYDWLYNLVQHINKEIRLRNKLEKENEKTLRAEGNTVKEMTDNLLQNNKARLDSLATERAMQEKQLQNRKREAEILMDVNSQFKKYAWFDQDRNEVQINYDAIVNSGMSADSKFSEYFSYLEDLQSKVESCEDALYDIDDGIYEVRNEGKDEFMNIEERLIQAIKEARQKEIDNLQTINDAIKDTNADLLNKVQEGVDEYRDAREKDKQLENIRDLEGQLALYGSDTSGASYLNYLDTQDSLDEAQQNYTDSLIDKSISEMTRQNEEAANQRQMQIDLMQATLEYDYEVGNLAKIANTLMGDISTNGKDIETYIKNAEGHGAMGLVNRTEWQQTLDQGLAKAQAWKDLSTYQGQIKQTISNVTTGSENSLKTALQQQFGTVSSGIGTTNALLEVMNKLLANNGQTDTTTPVTITKPDMNNSLGNGSSGGGSGGNYNYQAPDFSSTTANVQYLDEATLVNLPNGYYDISGAKFTSPYKYPYSSIIFKHDKTISVPGLVNDEGGLRWKQVKFTDVAAVTKNIPKSAAALIEASSWDEKKKQIISKISKMNNISAAYATGGLNTTTGPAWLDGTRARPEYVLNADQTQAFLKLTNALTDTSTDNKQLGNNYYNIEIQVDKLENDYDVDQLAGRIEERIISDANYRNTVAVDLRR